MAKEIKIFISTIMKYVVAGMVLSSMVFGFCSTANFVPVNQASAAGVDWWQRAQNGGLNQVGQAYGTSQPRDLRIVVIDIIKIILGFLGIIAVVLILFAGFKWMTAAGNEEQVSDAKKILIAGIIGLVIILCSYIIANFVISRIYGAVTGQPVIWD